MGDTGDPTTDLHAGHTVEVRYRGRWRRCVLLQRLQPDDKEAVVRMPTGGPVQIRRTLPWRPVPTCPHCGQDMPEAPRG